MHALSTATLFWLVAPMSTVVILAFLSFLVSLLTNRGGEQ